MKLDWEHLRARIAAGEDEHTERKLWDAFPDKAAIAIAAFANSDGGLVILGVADDGSLVGVPGDVDEAQEKLSTLLQTGLSAPVSATLGHHVENGVAIHWVDLALQTAWIDLVAYDGTDRAADVILHGEAKGRLDEQVERAVGWLKALGINERYEGIHRTESLVVPERAFREAIVNAVAHRDYAIIGSSVLVEVFTDRLDVTSPGTLPNHMTEATVLAGAAPRARNQLIAHFLLVSRLMERRGRGFPIMRKEMRAFNGTEPGLLSSDNGRFVRVTLRRSKE